MRNVDVIRRNVDVIRRHVDVIMRNVQSLKYLMLKSSIPQISTPEKILLFPVHARPKN